MRTLIKIFMITAFVVSCKAQSPIISIYDGDEEQVDGCYLKDVDGDFDPYVAVWKWQDGNNIIVMKFQKIEAYYDPGSKEYQDYLVGGYSYTENGLEVTNSLNFSITGDPFNYNTNTIAGSGIFTNYGKAPPCDECDPNTRMISAFIKDPTYPGVNGRLYMKHYVENGVEKLRIRITNTQNDFTVPVDAIMSIPEGIYTFVKQ